MILVKYDSCVCNLFAGISTVQQRGEKSRAASSVSKELHQFGNQKRSFPYLHSAWRVLSLSKKTKTRAGEVSKRNGTIFSYWQCKLICALFNRVQWCVILLPFLQSIRRKKVQYKQHYEHLQSLNVGYFSPASPHVNLLCVVAQDSKTAICASCVLSNSFALGTHSVRSKAREECRKCPSLHLSFWFLGLRSTFLETKLNAECKIHVLPFLVWFNADNIAVLRTLNLKCLESCEVVAYCLRH